MPLPVNPLKNTRILLPLNKKEYNGFKCLVYHYYINMCHLRNIYVCEFPLRGPVTVRLPSPQSLGWAGVRACVRRARVVHICSGHQISKHAAAALNITKKMQHSLTLGAILSFVEAEVCKSSVSVSQLC